MAYLTLMPRPPFPPFIPTLRAEQLAHAAVQASLSYLLFLWIAPTAARYRTLAAAAIGAMVLSIVFAAAIEILQYFFASTRAAQGQDMLIGTAGALVGGFAALILSQTRFSRKWQWRASAAFVFLSMLTTGMAMVAWDPSYPRVGDHWHAPYAIEICGERMPPLPGAQGAVHTHGDGLIHVHPFTEDTAGHNATLALAFATSGARLGDDYLVLPDGQRFSKRNSCPDGHVGQLELTVNGEQVDTPSTYVPRNGDVILVRFD